MSSNGRSRWLVWGGSGAVALVLVIGVLSSGLPSRVVNACSSVVTYNATVQAPSAGGTISPAPGAYAYTANSVVQFTAIPDPYWEFVSWSGNVSGTANPIGVTVSNHFTIQPTFKPVIQFGSAQSSVMESESLALIDIGCGGINSTNVTFSYTVSGTATPNVDYTALSGQGFISAGAAFTTLHIPITADSLIESNETVVLTLTGVNGRGATLGTVVTHTLTIQDDTLPTASVTALYSAPEAGQSEGFGQFLVTLSQPCPNWDCYVAFDPTGGTAINGTDFSTDPSPIWFSPGESQKTISYWSLFDDNIDTFPNKTFPLRLVHTTSRKSAPVSTTGGEATGTITDNDETLTIIVRDIHTHTTPTYACGNVEPPSGVYPTDFPIDLKAPGNGIGSAFVQFDGDIESTAYGVKFRLDSSKTIYANFVETRSFSYSVEPGGFDPFNNPIGSGYVTEYGLQNPSASNLNWGVYEKGTVATVQAVAYPGWRFSHWTNYNSSALLPFATGSDAASNPASFVMSDHVFVTANFVSVCGLVLNQATGGTVSASTPAVVTDGIPYYDVNTPVTLTASAAPDHLFQEWIIQAADGSVTRQLTNPAQLTIAGNLTVTPVFIQKYTLTTAVLENGTTNATGGTVYPTPGPHEYPTQAMVHLKAEPSTGWCFLRWDGITGPSGQTITNPETDITMNSDKSATAVFTRGAKLTIIASGQGTFSCVANGQTIPYSSISYLPPATQISVTATPAADWQFSAWSGYIDSNEQTVQLTMDSDQVLIARFEHKPGAASLDLVADLAEFLVAVGALPSIGEISQLTFDTGDLESDRVTPKPNGIPDVAEFMLLQAVLKSASYDQTPFGGAGHDHVWNCWTTNLTQAQTDLPNATPGVQRAIAAYMTLGSKGHRAFATTQAQLHLSASLNTAAYSKQAARYFDAEGDVDGDGFWNRLEWKTLLSQTPGNATTSTAQTYVQWALDGHLPAPADVDFGLDLGSNKGASFSPPLATQSAEQGGGVQFDISAPESGSGWPYAGIPATRVECSAGYGSSPQRSYEVRILDPPGREQEVYRVSTDEVVHLDLPSGSEILVTAARSAASDWFRSWSIGPITSYFAGGSRSSRTERIRVWGSRFLIAADFAHSWRYEPFHPEQSLDYGWSVVGPRAHLTTYDSVGADVPDDCHVRLEASMSSGRELMWVDLDTGVWFGGPKVLYINNGAFCYSYDYFSIRCDWECSIESYSRKQNLCPYDATFGYRNLGPYHLWPYVIVPFQNTSGGTVYSEPHGAPFLCGGWDTLEPVLFSLAHNAVAKVITDRYHLDLRPLPDPGYEFSHWTGGNPDAGTRDSFTADASSGLLSPKANFVPMYSMSVEQQVINGNSPAEAGHVLTENAQAFFTTQSVTAVFLTAVPHPGYRFDHWELDGPAYAVNSDGTPGAAIAASPQNPVTNPKIVVKMADPACPGDRTPTAVFSQNCLVMAPCDGIRVSVNNYPPGGTSGFFWGNEIKNNPSGKLQLLAYPDDGYALVKWTEWNAKQTAPGEFVKLGDPIRQETSNPIQIDLSTDRIVEVQGRTLDAQFLESSDRNYGFDKFSNPPGVWKSLPENGACTATVKFCVPPQAVDLIPPDGGRDAVLYVTPPTATQISQPVTIHSKRSVPDSGGSDSSDVTAVSGGGALAAMHTRVYRSFGPFVVHIVPVRCSGASQDSPGTVNTAELQSFLNDVVFDQCTVSFTVVPHEEVYIQYDINGDGLLESRPDKGRDGNPCAPAESIALKDALASSETLAPRELWLFLVKKMSEDGVHGYAFTNSPWVFVEQYSGTIHTIAHELGHALGGLDDLESRDRRGATSDAENLMAYVRWDGYDDWRLRVSQWDAVQAAARIRWNDTNQQ